MSRNLTDRELGIQKVNIRTPADVDAAINELLRQEHRSKNAMYVVLLKEALACRGILFDDENNRLPDDINGSGRVYLSIEKGNPAFYGELVASVDAMHVFMPDEEGVQCTISFEDERGNMNTRLVALDELTPYWYIPRRKVKEEESDFKTATAVPKNLL